ncbi:hypothetical protein GCM10027592_29160 [Spirosoma flavus]
MEISEKEIETMIWEAAGTEAGRKFLTERGLEISGTMLRQVGLGNYGVADLITMSFNWYGHKLPNGSRECAIDIYELKKEAIDVNALGQALRYMEAVRHFLGELNLNLHLYFGIHLIGKSINHSQNFLPLVRTVSNAQEFECSTVFLYEYKFDFDGIRFHRTEGSNYSMSDNGNPSRKQFSYSALRAIARDSLRYS